MHRHGVEPRGNSQEIKQGGVLVTSRGADGEIPLGLTTFANNPVQDSDQRMHTNPMHQVCELGETADELKARATRIYADKSL